VRRIRGFAGDVCDALATPESDAEDVLKGNDEVADARVGARFAMTMTTAIVPSGSTR
jgi:hypothetical protein